MKQENVPPQDAAAPSPTLTPTPAPAPKPKAKAKQRETTYAGKLGGAGTTGRCTV